MTHELASLEYLRFTVNLQAISTDLFGMSNTSRKWQPYFTLFTSDLSLLHPDHQHGLWGGTSGIQYTGYFIDDHAWTSLIKVSTFCDISYSTWEKFLVRKKRQVQKTSLATSAISGVVNFCEENWDSMYCAWFPVWVSA